MQLPDGFSARSLTTDDLRSVYEVVAAQELADVGEVVIDEADIVADWQRPSFDLAASTIGVFAGDRLVAYAEIGGGDRGDASVHPDLLGRGLGRWLADWMQLTARARAVHTIGMPVPAGSAGDRLLAALGYRVRWTSWVLQLPDQAKVPSRPLPAGHAVRAATAGNYRACWTVLEDAFLEWSVREREPYEDFVAKVTGRPGFESWHLRLVTDEGGDVVAVASSVVSTDRGRPQLFVERLATRADRRGRGLAQVLLCESFATARAHGVLGAGLSTDSRTGALGLYEKIGMRVTSTWVNRAIDLTEGTDS